MSSANMRMMLLKIGIHVRHRVLLKIAASPVWDSQSFDTAIYGQSVSNMAVIEPVAGGTDLFVRVRGILNHSRAV